MVDSVVTKQELIDAQKDAQSLEDVINGPADTRVKPRIGPEMWTLATINSLVQQGQIKISDLSEVIQIALAAGAGSAGWTASLVADGNQTQKEINLYGGKKYDMPVGGYPVGAIVRLANGDIVKSTVANNTANPNVDMTGWVKTNNASQIKYGNQNQAQINARTVTPYDFGAFGDGIAHPLSERYATLAAARSVYPSATSLDEYIDGHAVNAWWRDICANDRKFATCHGRFISNTKISNAGLNDPNNYIKTGHIDFAAYIGFGGLSDILENGFEIVSPRLMQLSGRLEIEDLNLTWANRKVNNILYMEDLLHSKHTWKVICRNARKLGLQVYSGRDDSLSGAYANNNTSDLGSWLFVSCGHRFKHGDFAFNSVTDTGTAGASGQRSVLSFASNLPFEDGALVDDFVNYKGKPYLIMANTANTVSVYPWLHDLDTSGTVQIAWGGDFQLDGADSNQIKMSSGSSGCAVCAGKEGFYSGFKDQRVNEGNDIGCRIGNTVVGTQRRLTVAGMYFENNVFDIVKTNLNTTDNTLFINPNSVDLAKCHVLVPLYESRAPHPYLNAPFTIQNGNYGTYTKKNGQFSDGQTPNATSSDLTIGDEHIKYRANSPTITLKDNPDFRRVFGNVDLSCEVFGIGGVGTNNNYTTGDTTIKCESGFTINGSSSDLVIPRSAPFWVSARLVSGTSWRVFIYYSEKPKASKTHDWASLAVGAQQSTTLQVFGANVGDSAVASMDVALSGTSLRAEVTATNTVTVYHHNPTVASVDVIGGTLFVKLL